MYSTYLASQVANLYGNTRRRRPQWMPSIGGQPRLQRKLTARFSG